MLSSWTISGIGFGAILVALTITGCEKQKEQTASAIEPNSPRTMTVETDSPDLTVKSWWKYIDIGNSYYQEKCKAIESGKSITTPFDQYGSKIVQGDVFKSQTDRYTQISNCSMENYEREIQEVKLESETRAIVYAKVKNSSPIPQGAITSPENIMSREKGARFKYVVEKTSEGWKISQVYKYLEGLSSDLEWQKMYSITPPSYPSEVYMQ